ncbi:MAG: DUF3822 family protein [Bacteroidia bacterium]|nr:DUF3822 family protein [Bacteroidia bacterium]
MKQISLIDETFNSLNSEHYIVTVQLLPDSLSYVVFDSVRKKYVLLKYIPYNNLENNYGELKSIVENEPFLKSKLEGIRAFIFTKDATIIPDSFLQKDKISHFTSFNFGDSDYSENMVCKSSFESNIAFSLPSQINEVLRSINCNTVYPLATTVLTEAHKDCLQKDNLSGLYINLLKNHVQVVVIKDSKLQLFNIFNYQTDDDFCYYILYLFDLFQFDKEKVPVTISGITQKNDSRIVKLEQFLKKLQYSKSNSKFVYSYRFNEIPQHHFSNLFIMPYEDNKW